MPKTRQHGRAGKRGAPKPGDHIAVETGEDGQQKATLKVPETFSKKLRHKLKGAQWYKPTRFFDGTAKRIVDLGDGNDVVMCGMLYQPGLGERIETLIKEFADYETGGIERDHVLQKLRASLGEPELALCLVPPAVSDGQSAALQMMLQANLRTSVLLLSNNVHLVRLNPVSDKVAAKLMEGDTDDKDDSEPEEEKIVVPHTSPGREAGEDERQGVREEDSEAAPADL